MISNYVKDLAFAVKMWRFSPMKKSAVSYCVFYCAAGVVNICLPYLMSQFMGLFLVSMSFSMLSYSYTAVNFSELVQTSPKATRLQTRIYVRTGVTCQMLGYLLSMVGLCILGALGRMDASKQGDVGLGIAVFSVICVVYWAVCCRGMVVSTLVFVIALVPFMLLFTNKMQEAEGSVTGLSFGAGVVLGVILLALAGFVGEKAAHILRKRPLDKKVLGAFGSNVLP